MKNAYFCLADDLRCLEWETVGDNDVEEKLLDLVVKELRLYDLRADLDLPKENARSAVNRAQGRTWSRMPRAVSRLPTL